MVSFLQYLLEKRGRKPKNPHHAEDVAHMISQFGKTDVANMTNNIRTAKKRYIDAIRDFDSKLVGDEDMSLDELSTIIRNNGIDLTKQIAKEKAWQKLENDVARGIQNMFRSGFFLIRKRDGQKIPVPCSSYATAKRAGGATDSDVEVNTGKGKFQVECKLNYTSAEYFKYGLKVENGKLTYNHKKFLSGLYDGTDQIRQMLLNDYIFTEEIRIGDFINEIVKSSDVKKSWDLFNKNINDICDFLIKSDEYRPFSAGIGHLSKFPDDFEQLSSIFDRYCEHYIRKYDKLIDKAFSLITDESVRRRKSSYTIGKRTSKHAKDDVVFQTVNNLLTDTGMNVSNYDMFFDLTTNIKRIEIKFKRILESLKKGSDDFRALLSLSNSDKLKYFFKLFISTAGNKTKNTKLNPLILQDSDKFGNFQLCSDIEVSNTRLGEMITSFYLNKDKCPYIQIKDTVFAFDLNQNVFNLPNLPVFKDFITSFSISLKISAELDEISLHIKAKEPDRTAFAGKTLVSFVQSDKNYVIKTLDPIVVIDEQS